MNSFAKLLLLLIIAASLNPGCSKNADPVPPQEEIVDEDSVSFPIILFGSEKKGKARIFTNGKEVFDSAYASLYTAETALYYFQNSEPPRKIQFDSKDTLGIFFTDYPAKYGIRKEGEIDYLYNRYPMGGVFEEDTNIVNYTINPATGFAHEVLTAYGDYKEYQIPVFAYVRSRYHVDLYDSTKTYLSYRKIGWKYSDFKESYISTLGKLDTFGIQEYELVYKKYTLIIAAPIR